MPLPDPHADEPAIEIPEELWRKREVCLEEAARWQRLADEATTQIKEIMGNATAALVAGMKVATYRPSRRYAIATLIRQNQELTEHYMKDVLKREFDLEAFIKVFPDIAEKYRVRSFVEVENT